MSNRDATIMSKRRIRAAVVQTLAGLGDLDHNIDLIERYTLEAARRGADLVVFPECMNTGYLFDSADHARKLAEPLDGKFVNAMARLCRRHGLHMASGITEWDAPRGTIFNSGVLLDPQGEIVVHYQKQFLATHDQNWFAFGVNGCPVADTALGRIGLLICFDGRIPEIARCLALQGAEVLVDMANFFAMDQAEMWGPARSYQNGVWLVAATKAGYERSIYYPGGSMIVDPGGRVRAMMPYDSHGVLVADVFPDEAHDKGVYADNDRIADRRPDAYTPLARPYPDTAVSGVHLMPLVPAESTSKVAAVQIHVGADTTTSEDVLAMLAHTAKLGVKVMALPEYAFLSDWMPGAEAARDAVRRFPDLLDKAAALCAEYACVLALPHVTEKGKRQYPSCTLIGPEGRVFGQYRKVHLTAEERPWAAAGDVFPVFETPFGRIGMMLGYDGFFPETARCLGIAGADIILWSANLREPFERRWLAVPNAADNRCVVVLANRVDGPDPGGSLVIPPTGFPHWDIDAVAPRNLTMGAVMPAFVDLAVCRQKQMIPKVDMFANRLTATYEPLVATARESEAVA